MCILVFIKIDNDRNYFLRLELRNNHNLNITWGIELKMIDIKWNDGFRKEIRPLQLSTKHRKYKCGNGKSLLYIVYLLIYRDFEVTL